MDIRGTVSAPRVSAALLAFGTLCTLGTSLTDLCPVRSILAYGSAAALVISAVGMLLGWSSARMAARIVCWLDIFLFAMLVVPDREAAVFSGSYGYHTFCGVLAVYFPALRHLSRVRSPPNLGCYCFSSRSTVKPMPRRLGAAGFISSRMAERMAAIASS